MKYGDKTYKEKVEASVNKYMFQMQLHMQRFANEIMKLKFEEDEKK